MHSRVYNSHSTKLAAFELVAWCIVGIESHCNAVFRYSFGLKRLEHLRKTTPKSNGNESQWRIRRRGEKRRRRRQRGRKKWNTHTENGIYKTNQQQRQRNQGKKTYLNLMQRSLKSLGNMKVLFTMQFKHSTASYSRRRHHHRRNAWKILWNRWCVCVCVSLYSVLFVRRKSQLFKYCPHFPSVHPKSMCDSSPHTIFLCSFFPPLF